MKFLIVALLAIMFAIPAHAEICDPNEDGFVDKVDLSIISRARGQTPLPLDPRDSNIDGLITPADVKVCIQLCTLPNCATQ